MKTNPNENCLESFRCPNCGSYGPFSASTRCWARWDDDGTLETTDHEILEDGVMHCHSCEHNAQVHDFRE